MSLFLRDKRPGFTLVELMVVIVVILLISSLFLGLNVGDGGGLAAGQRAIASSLRTARAMALMNRGLPDVAATFGPRYRLLILDDPQDEVNHLRQIVVAIGGHEANQNTDPTTLLETDRKWYAPQPPTSLPKGVVFVPPASSVSTTVAVADASIAPRSLIGQVADGSSSNPPSMMFAPVITPKKLSEMNASLNAKKWFFVELQSSGASNHLGRTLLVLALGTVRNTGTSTASVDIADANKFAALLIRPSGEISMTSDSEEVTKAK